MKKNLTSIYHLICSLFVAISAFSSTASAQSQNCLNFDNIDDNVSVPAASSRITGGTGISITCWVYPTNSTSLGYPDFDGFAGFRNETDADFYLLQLAPNQDIEARFRNSSGTAVTITSAGSLAFNTWQHLALTYNGSMLRLFKNGIQIDSAAATGSIANSLVDFLIGDLHYTTAEFYLQGKLDEVSLWNRALTTSEVNCIYHAPIDTSMSGLQLYYHFNQGIASGNNTSITSLTDAMGHINGTLNNFTLTGTTSNFVAGVSNVTSQAVNICPGTTYTFGSQTLSASGVYQRTLTAVNGCDSVIELTLHVTDTSVTRSGATFHANQTGATYQWVNCTTGFSAISGAVGQNYTPTANGSYAVIVSQSGCTDTSLCHTFTSVGIAENNFKEGIHVYPNPALHDLTIDFSQSYRNIIVTVLDVTGKEISKAEFNETNRAVIDVSALDAGIYFLQVISGNESAMLRMVK